MRIFGPIVLPQALLMVAGKPKMLEGRAVGAQLVGRHPLRREALLAEQLAHELDGRRPVSAALDQDLEDLAFMVDGTPQVHMLAGDPHDHFVEMPSVARSWAAPPQIASDHRSEFEHPTANALVGDVEPTLGKQLLDIAIAQSEAQVEPNRVLNHGRRKTVPAIGDRKHPRSLRPVGDYSQVILTMPPAGLSRPASSPKIPTRQGPTPRRRPRSPEPGSPR